MCPAVDLNAQLMSGSDMPLAVMRKQGPALAIGVGVVAQPKIGPCVLGDQWPAAGKHFLHGAQDVLVLLPERDRHGARVGQKLGAISRTMTMWLKVQIGPTAQLRPVSNRQQVGVGCAGQHQQ